MALTADQVAYFESRLGTPLDEADLEARVLRLGSDPKAAVEVLETRLATLLTKPLSFTIPGDYSEDRTQNAKQLQAMLELAGDEVDGGVGNSASIMRAVMPATQRWSR